MFSHFRQKVFSRIVKIAFHVSRGTFWGETIFEKIQFCNHFQFLSKKIDGIHDNVMKVRFYESKGTFWGFFKKIIFVTTSEISAKTFQNFVGNFLGKIVQTPLYLLKRRSNNFLKTFLNCERKSSTLFNVIAIGKHRLRKD